MKTCFSCRKELDTSTKPGRRDQCPSCGADMRACLNCLFYDPSAYNECKEPSAERVLDKDKANFCDYFQFGHGSAPKEDNKDKAKKALDDLFGCP